MPKGSVTIPVPENTHVSVVGITNSGSWAQRISVTPSWGGGVLWTGKGAQTNDVVGSTTFPPFSGRPDATITVTMAYDPGSGFQPSAVETDGFNLPGLDGYVVGGQDGGGRRPNEPAYHNTVAFVYFSPTY
jgi:hypothetical protein